MSKWKGSTGSKSSYVYKPVPKYKVGDTCILCNSVAEQIGKKNVKILEINTQEKYIRYLVLGKSTKVKDKETSYWYITESSILDSLVDENFYSLTIKHVV